MIVLESKDIRCLCTEELLSDIRFFCYGKNIIGGNGLYFVKTLNR